MQSKRLTTEPPCITEEVFEEFLATDDTLVEYFNEFLSLPTFAQTVKFNSDFGVFEVVNDAPQCLESQLKKSLHEQKSPKPIYDALRKVKNDGHLSKMRTASPTFNIDANYNTMCLDREQAIQWIKKERLPAFLESDCYFEYRLAKLISQVEWSKTGINFIIDNDYYPWIRKQDPSPSPPEEDDTSMTVRKLNISLGVATVSQTKDCFTLAKGSELMKTTDSFSHPIASSQTQCLSGQRERDDSLSEKDSLLEAGSLSKEAHQWSFLRPSRKAKAIILRKTSREAEEGSSVAIAELPAHTQLRVYVDPKWDSAAKKKKEQESVTIQTPGEFIPDYTQLVMKEPASESTHQPTADIHNNVDFHKQPELFIHELSNNEFARGTAESLLSQSSPFSVLDSHRDVREQDTEEVSLKSSSESGGSDSRAWCISHRTSDTGNRHEFERFKKFIKGTLGERYWWLWMDIERLKVLKTTTRQQRQLNKMKKLYLLSSGDYFLSSEVLLRLNLLHGDQWNVRHLRRIQPEVVKPLLLYWGPRFRVTDSTAIQTASAKLKMWHTCQQRPRVDIDPFPHIVSLLPLTLKSCMPRIPPSLSQKSRTSSPATLLKPPMSNFSLKKSSKLLPTLPSRQSPQRDDISTSRKWPKSANRDMIYCSAVDDTKDSKCQGHRKYTYAELLQGKSASGSAVLRGSRMESMLQSLYLDNRAGYYFTQFCEKSGNKLWKNSVYFWFDLQAYHQLFYQETLHPFKICKQAQFLYATYIAPSASMDIGLHQRKRNMIYQKIDPAFEDLFDPAEEYILTVLIEPWMKMMEEDKYTYGKVELVEETRQLDSVYFRKLQALHQESGSKKHESTVADTGLPSCPDALKEDKHLSQVPKELTGPNLSDLIHDKEKLEHFWAFLNERSASMDLMCWLDIEQFRETLHKDKENREEKSKDIKNKYFNKQYFFGPNSPATREQQEQIIHSGGGWGQILQDQFSATVLLEIQQCVQKRLEEQWLPLFLADEHHRVEGQAKIRDITEDLSRQKQKTTRLWKQANNKCVSSSSEVIAFRKALLNPVTANEFQRFVSLQGDLLANGLLFWQEVQKYKDLCHSHCDDTTIQKKITTIIDCFINSAIPPALQIDIPMEQAKKILEHRRELGPYIFREAQMSIFALLFKFWPKFCKLQSNLASDKILLALERKKGKKMQKKEDGTAEIKEVKNKSWPGAQKLSFYGEQTGKQTVSKATRQLTQGKGGVADSHSPHGEGRQPSTVQRKDLLSGKQKGQTVSKATRQLTQGKGGVADSHSPHGEGRQPSTVQRKDLLSGKQEGGKEGGTKPGTKPISLLSSAFTDETGVKTGQAPFSVGHESQASWSYSKYIEALEQERVLLKMQEDLEKASSSVLTAC
ncbi:regulator of G-protein signaling 22 isoform X2 [Pezoporus flaviventris]|uniref:regulator of G-protein signaling 22 isoform X2 n=1 Tax=Pezoporus flaviventris TaxID=889875 RepID=UPI002AB2BE31|nr:regulator of G-protein signaling 22 isoform X2 [Pezoporus flaviventris]